MLGLYTITRHKMAAWQRNSVQSFPLTWTGGSSFGEARQQLLQLQHDTEGHGTAGGRSSVKPVEDNISPTRACVCVCVFRCLAAIEPRTIAVSIAVHLQTIARGTPPLSSA